MMSEFYLFKFSKLLFVVELSWQKVASKNKE